MELSKTIKYSNELYDVHTFYARWRYSNPPDMKACSLSHFLIDFLPYYRHALSILPIRLLTGHLCH